MHGGRAFVILKRVWEGKFSPKLGNEPNMEHIQMYKDWVGADHVLRDQTHYLFCETIPDVEFEEIEKL